MTNAPGLHPNPEKGSTSRLGLRPAPDRLQSPWHDVAPVSPSGERRLSEVWEADLPVYPVELARTDRCQSGLFFFLVPEVREPPGRHAHCPRGLATACS